MKRIDLELKIDGKRKHLTYSDYHSGRDIVCEIVDGKLIKNEKEISLNDFILLIERSIDEY
jgi:hypothetical protein